MADHAAPSPDSSPAFSGPPPVDAVVLGLRPLTVDEVVAVSRHGAPVRLGDEARAAMERARAVVAARAESDEAIYGVNTGFGSLARTRIAPADIRDVQTNLVRSHAAGAGSPLPEELVRGMMLLLAASLARGHSGARPVLVERLLAMLDAGVHPRVPSIGSVGASGDLAPLAHVALCLLGEGFVEGPGGEPVATADALAAANIAPVALEAKEGLALLNGTHLMAAMAALAVHDADLLIAAALGSAAMALDACRGTDTPFDGRIHAVRGQPGQIAVAAALRDLLTGSTILPAHRVDDPRVQDPYCLRCTPQVLGAAVDGIAQVRRVAEYELGAVSDNPLVFPGDGPPESGDILSGGNFHGMPLAIALDHLAICLCHVAGIAERRVYWLLAARDPENPVQPYLSPRPGLHSGLMITQYTAAACCNELQQLASPASVGNVPTSAGVEDYNSFGPAAGFQARQALERARTVIAIEYLVMGEGLEAQRPLRSGDEVERRHAILRRVVAPLREDRPPAPDIAAIEGLIAGGELGGAASVAARA
jgi:histidine ammonia-lyase